LVLLIEIKLSAVQSVVLPALASQLTWRLDRGESPRIVFPHEGPYDVASGYSSLPAFQRRLITRGYRVVDQARFSKALAMAASLGLTPPARDKTATGLLISDERGHIGYDAVARLPRFSRYDDIPDVIVRSLLYMEDRRMLGPSRPSLNPAVDIGRLARAAVFSAGSTMGLPFAFQGGSTLAIQIEKYRHSQSGRTGSVLDKLRQIVSASLRVYHDGPDTARSGGKSSSITSIACRSAARPAMARCTASEKDCAPGSA
jgi:membrane peptidoglycan carboxypeptidase